MKIIGISGSPRKNGNTESMINYISKENQLEIIRLYEKKLNPCTACNGCSKTGECIIKDDMLSIMHQIEQADIVILGSPIYWWNVSAPFKTFVDRWYSKNVRSIISSKKIILAFSMADSSDETSKWALGSLKDSLEYIGADVIGTIVGKGLWEKNDIENHKELIKDLKAIIQ